MTESHTQATLPGVDFHLLTSTIAEDDFEVSVAVLRQTYRRIAGRGKGGVEDRRRGPAVGQTIQSADDTGTQLPVVYVLDANIIFAMAVQIAWNMITVEELPEMIVVGIGHPVGSLLADPDAAQEYVRARVNHMTPTVTETSGGGGANQVPGLYS